MKASAKFISVYYVCCVLVVIAIKSLLNLFSVEIFSYLLWFYLEGLLLGLLLYPPAKMLIKRLLVGYAINIAIDGVLCLILLNLVSLIAGHRILTLDLLKKGIDLQDNNLLIHLISLLCFVLTVVLVGRKEAGVKA